MLYNFYRNYEEAKLFLGNFSLSFPFEVVDFEVNVQIFQCSFRNFRLKNKINIWVCKFYTVALIFTRNANSLLQFYFF